MELNSEQCSSNETIKSDVLYVCDGMTCDDCHGKECTHATDIAYAKKLKNVDGVFIEDNQIGEKNEL